MRTRTLVAFLFLMTYSCIYAQTLKSPDGKFEMNFHSEQANPYYNLKYKGNIVVEESHRKNLQSSTQD